MEKPGFVRYIVDFENGKICGRSPLRCLFLFGWLTGLYVLLVALTTTFIAIYLEVLDTTYPHYPQVNSGDPPEAAQDSLTQGNPGIGMRPVPYYRSTLIRFQQGKPSTYSPYTDHIDGFLLDYEDKLYQGRDIKTCSLGAGEAIPLPKDPAIACRFDIVTMFQNTDCTRQRDYGFEKGQPCVLLKMNRLYGFFPEAHGSLKELTNNTELNGKPPRFLAFQNHHIGISCEGDTMTDKENLLELKFYPESGIHPGYYPFWNQEGYRSPLVMVQFVRTTKRVVIQVTCRLWAKNINNSAGPANHGSIHFELLRD